MPVDAIFDDFEREMSTYGMTLALVEATSELPHLGVMPEYDEAGPHALHLAAIDSLSTQVKSAQVGIPSLRGALFVLCVARFESLIRNQIEDLALRASQNVDVFSQLPSAMRDNLQRLAADVIGSPKKYRMETHVKSIAVTLARNLSNESERGEINNYCMSITHDNMRAETLGGLFERFGIKDTWSRVGFDTDLQVLLQLHQPDAVTSSAKKRLNAAIESRNRFSHPSGTVIWPSATDVSDLVALLVCIGRAVSKLIPVYEIQLKPQAVAALA